MEMKGNKERNKYVAVLRTMYKNWMRLGRFIGSVNTKILLGLTFYLVFTPVSLILKILQIDTLIKKFDYNSVTYRKESEKLSDDRMEKTY